MKLQKKAMLASGFLAVLCLLFAALFGLGELAAVAVTGELDALDAGERWSSEPYATIALHTDAESALSLQQVESYVRAVDTGLLNASIEAPENGSAWTYAYFAEDVLSVKGPKATAALQTIAAGGSFFTFHPLEFADGAPFRYDRALPDGVVLDEDAAWRLFGALNVVGMTVEIGGRELTVTGIVRHERDTDRYERAYGEIPRIYMSYYGYGLLYGETNNITTFEATIPNPVKSFAMNIFKTAVQINEDTMAVRENSDRYSIVNRFNRMKELPYMGMRVDRIVYPYFENELQAVDYTTSVWMIWQSIAGGLAAASLLASLICLFTGGFSLWKLFAIWGRKAADTLEKRRTTKRTRSRKHRRNRKDLPGRRSHGPEKYTINEQ